MRKTGLLVVIALLCVSLFAIAGCGGNKETSKAGDANTVTLKLGHFAASDHPGNAAAKMFAENVEKRTNGAVKVMVYPDNQLGSPPELLEQTIMGTIDMSLGTQGSLDKYSKKFAVVMLPFIFNNYEHAYKVLDGPFAQWAAPDLEAQGLIFLANWDYGFRNITNNTRPINSPDDMKGLKMRTPPEIQLQSAMEALGANVSKISFAELFMALKQGVVDGQENPLAVIYFNKYYEAQKYLAITNHVYNSMVHVISKKSWDKLTPDQQKIVKEESQKAGNWMRQQIQAQEKETIANLEKAGMQVTYPDPTAFRAKMGPAYERIGEYAGKDNVDTFVKMAESVK